MILRDHGARGLPVTFRLILFGLGFVLASPAFAWSGSTIAGDYSVTANVDANRLQSISLAPQSRMAARSMQLHAWFVDAEGGILAQAPLPDARANGAILIAQANRTPVPTDAIALVVMAQPAGLTHAAAAERPAVIAQIALR